MTEMPTTAVSASGPLEEVAFEAVRTDAVLSGRAMSSGVFLAGLIAAAELETVGRPDRLPDDLFPGVDPGVVQAVWDRALAVGLHAGRLSASPRLYRDQLERIGVELAEAGFHAMGGLVGRSRRVVARDVVGHPADGEDLSGHGAV